jgi:hypothetical protein
MLGTFHPTITSPEQGLSILSRFAADFRYPEAHEGYDRILSLKPVDTSFVYSRLQIATILRHVHGSPVIAPNDSIRSSWEWRSFRGFRSAAA